MEQGELTITIWYNDFKDIPDLSAKLTNLIRLPSTKIIEFHKSHMRIRGEAAVLETLYNN